MCTFWYPKLNNSEGQGVFFLEIVDHVPGSEHKAPSSSDMVSMYRSIFRYLDVKSLAMISKPTS